MRFKGRLEILKPGGSWMAVLIILLAVHDKQRNLSGGAILRAVSVKIPDVPQ